MNSSNTNAQIDQGRRRLLDTATMHIAAAGAAIALVLVVWGGKAISAQDRYTLKIPGGGLAFSEFRGYETWQDVSVSQTETSLKVIAASRAMASFSLTVPKLRRSSGPPKGTMCLPIS